MWPKRWQPIRLLRPWDFPGKNAGADCHFLLQGIFPTQESNPGLPHRRQTLYHLSHQGSKTIELLWKTAWLFLTKLYLLWSYDLVICSLVFTHELKNYGLLRWLSGKESTCQFSRYGFDPWIGKTPWRGKCQVTPASYLENPMDRGTWPATVYGITKSRTQLSNWIHMPEYYIHTKMWTYMITACLLVFPGGSDGKTFACNARDPGSISGWGRSAGEGNGNPLQYSCLENSMDRGAL